MFFSKMGRYDVSTMDRCKSHIQFAVAVFCGVLVSLLLASPVTVAAQAGHLDTSFANKGIFVDNFDGASAAATAVALQSDGKIVVAGEKGGQNTTAARGIVVRLTTDGKLDDAFGTAGVVSIRFGSIDSTTTGMAIQSDGKIVVSGHGIGAGNGLVARLDTDGGLDTTFGSGGFIVLFPNGPGPLVIQSDGKIVMAGGAAGVPALLRFTSSGQLDTTFGSGGAAALAFGGNLGLQPNGKFLVAGGGLLARYNTNGTLDTTFGTAGQAATLASPAFAFESNGEVVTAGSIVTKASLNGNFSGFGLSRVGRNGVTDTTFGTRGNVVTSFPGLQSASAGSIVIQSNGDLVAGGTAASSSIQASFALARYLADSQRDMTFGTQGIDTTSFGNSTTAGISGLAIQTDGKIVAVGSDRAGNLIVARYLGH